MKRNYFVLSLILMFFGISASYAGVFVGDQVTDPSTLKDGTKILLRASTKEGSTDPAQYKWVTSLKDSMLWAVNELTLDAPIDPYTPFVLETAEGDIKGQPVFYVKNVKNNMYITYLFEDTVRNEEGELEGSILIDDKGKVDAQCRLIYTSDKASASAFTFVLATTGVDWNVNGAYTGEKQPEATSIMMFTKCKEYTEGELLLALNQAYGTPWAANYTDWGGWFEVYLQKDVPVSYKDDLSALLEKLTDIVYIGGEGPGCYDAAMVKEYTDAMSAATQAITTSADEATCKAAYERLETAWLNLAVASANPVTASYYKFRNWASDATNIKMLNAAPGKVTWINWNKLGANPSCVWEVIDRYDGTFLMRNIATNEYISGTGAASESGSPSIVTSKDSTGNAITFTNVGGGQFTINHKNSSNLHAEWSSTGGDGVTKNVVSWASAENTASAWYFEILSEDSIAYYKKIGDQLILDQKLEELLLLAQEKYDLGNAFNYNVETDSLVVSPKQFLSNAAQMSTDTVYTNPRGVWGTGADGSGYAALLDGTLATYFHSAYSGTIAEPHYMDIDLGKEVNGFVIAYSKRGNNANNLPKAYQIYTAKADADTSLVESWTLLNQVTDQPQDKDTVYSKGFDCPEGCRYVRFLVTETKNNAKLNGYPFFTLGGMQVYEAKKSDACFNVVNSEVSGALLSAIAEASKIKSGEVIQADIDKLQAAIDAYLAEFPDPTELNNLISEVETELAASIAVDQATDMGGYTLYPDPGTYSVAAKAACEAVLTEAKNYIAENAVLGIYDAQKLEEYATKITEAKNLFLSQMRTIDFADNESDGKWYHIAAANNYFNMTAPDPNQMRTGILYVRGDGTLENSTIYWDKEDSIKENYTDYAKWRFIQLTDSTYAIQNKGTQLYIGHYQTHPASLSASPVAFEIINKGYGAYLFKGHRLNGEDVANNYLHSQVTGKTLVYWNSTNFGGSTWEIHNADDSRTEAGDEVKNYRPKEIENYTQLQAGKLYAMCYPLGIDFIYDTQAPNNYPYVLNGINLEEKTVTLAPSMDVLEPGQPFFYLAGDDLSLLKPQPGASDTVSVTMQFLDLKEVALTPLMVNGLIGEYNNVTYPEGMSALVETTETDANNVVTKRTQSIQAASGETGWNTAYIMAGLVENLEAVEGSITVKIDGDLDTAIKDAIADAQLGNVNVYSIDGVLIKKNVKASEATNGLAKGLYIIGNTKVVVK